MNAKQPPVDRVLTRIADYVVNYRITSKSAYEMARYCLLDSLACALNAQRHPECRKMLGAVVPGTTVLGGARVPGTKFKLDPVKAAFDISTSIRWLEHNDTCFGKDSGHPSDGLGAIIAVADYLCRTRGQQRRKLNVKDVLSALIKVYEIQGQLLDNNDFTGLGLDSIAMVNVASSAVVTHMLGGSRDQVVNAMSNAWLDGVSLRLYRSGHNAGWRKAWAAGDAASRGVMHGLMAVRGEPGYPAALTTPVWGLSDVVMRGNPVVLDGPLGTHIVEHILFRVPFPAHFHTQTASECAFKFHRPLGRARRRREGLPLVDAKFQQSLRQSFSARRQKHICSVCSDYSSMKSLPFNRFMELFAVRARSHQAVVS